jgi:hypothetical protein
LSFILPRPVPFIIVWEVNLSKLIVLTTLFLPLTALAVAPAPAPAHGPAAWSDVPGSEAWTAAAVAAVSANLQALERAADKDSFCPGYDTAPAERRVTCWVRLISAIARYESGFDPKNSYQEASGNYSVGLLQLSTGECDNAETLELLQDPVQNLICGTRRMAALIARDGYVTSPDNVHGAAAYWSVLRAPYMNGTLHLGRRDDVMGITASYSTVTPVNL